MGGNLCYAAGGLVNLQKSEEKSRHGGWRYLLPCWYLLMLMARCKASGRVVPFTRAGTCYRVSGGIWRCTTISLETMGLYAFLPCLLYNALQLSNDAKENLQNLVHPLFSLSG